MLTLNYNDGVRVLALGFFWSFR